MKRLVLLAAAAALMLPTSTHAAPATKESVGVTAGTLSYTSGAGTVDTVELADGSGGTVISETSTPTGTLAGNSCTSLTATSAVCSGVQRAWLQTLDGADTIVNVSSLPATLDGGTGNDSVTGGGQAETIRGGDGHDVLSGGGGLDSVDGGIGDDQIDVRDGSFDAVDCGAGTDAIAHDRIDIVLHCEIETVLVTAPAADGVVTPQDRPVPGTPGATSETEGGAPDPLSVPKLLAPAVTVIGPVTAHVAEGTTVAVPSSGKAPFVLGCAADAPSACTGVVFIDPAPAKRKQVRGRKARGSSARAFMARRGRYGTSPFRVRPGSERTLQIKLTALARRALGLPRGKQARAARRGRRVRAVVTVAPKNSRAQKVKITLKG